MIGLLGRKKGMSSIFDQNGKNTPVTVIEAGPCPVVQVKTEQIDGYSAFQLGFDSTREKLVTRPLRGHFKKSLTKPVKLLREFRNMDCEYKAGDTIRADIFKPGDMVDVTGMPKGRGFAGVIKRHGFHSPNQTHGTHEAFRGPGSIGSASFPARVWPGQKMPGRMGGRNVTVKNLRVLKVDTDKGLVVVKGAVPGAPGGYLFIKKNR